jgi:hypothetical protein
MASEFSRCFRVRNSKGLKVLLDAPVFRVSIKERGVRFVIAGRSPSFIISEALQEIKGEHWTNLSTGAFGMVATCDRY